MAGSAEQALGDFGRILDRFFSKIQVPNMPVFQASAAEQPYEPYKNDPLFRDYSKAKIAQLQAYLSRLGYYNFRKYVDGEAGPGTVEAVQNWLNRNGYEPATTAEQVNWLYSPIEQEAVNKNSISPNEVTQYLGGVCENAGFPLSGETNSNLLDAEKNRITGKTITDQAPQITEFLESAAPDFPFSARTTKEFIKMKVDKLPATNDQMKILCGQINDPRGMINNPPNSLHSSASATSGKSFEILQAQILLRRLNYRTGETDGEWEKGGNTETALKEFQTAHEKDKKLTVTGNLDPNTLQALGEVVRDKKKPFNYTQIPDYVKGLCNVANISVSDASVNIMRLNMPTQAPSSDKMDSLAATISGVLTNNALTPKEVKDTFQFFKGEQGISDAIAQKLPQACSNTETKLNLFGAR